MKNKYIFLRHAETLKDPNKAPVEWDLTAEALGALKVHIDGSAFKDVDLIITSAESKAIATAKPICELLNIASEAYEDFNEVQRTADFLSEEEFLIQKLKQFEKLDDAVDDCESASDALKRFKTGIARLEETYLRKTILIVSHGTILTLFFSHYLSILDNPELMYSRWSTLPFCAVGVIANDQIEKDINPSN